MQDHRSSPRCIKHLRAVLITEENGKQSKLNGKTQDISLTGVSFVSRYNISCPRSATVCLLISPGDEFHPPVIFEAESKILSSVLSPQQGGFRLGMEFTRIVGEGKQILQKLLVARMAQVG